MAITVTLTADSPDELSEPLRKAAKENGGKWTVSGLPEGFAVENVAGLRSTVKALRDELNAEKAKAGQYQAFDDAGLKPESARDAAEALQKVKTGALKGNDEIEAWKKAASDKYAADLAQQKRELEAANAELEENLVNGQLAPVIAAKGGSESMDAIRILARQSIRVVKDEKTGKRRLAVVSPDGSVLTTKKAGSIDPMGLDEFIDGMRESPVTKGLFTVRNAGGSGSTSQNRGPVPGGGQDSANLSPMELIQRANERAARGAGAGA